MTVYYRKLAGEYGVAISWALAGGQCDFLSRGAFQAPDSQKNRENDIRNSIFDFFVVSYPYYNLKITPALVDVENKINVC